MSVESATQPTINFGLETALRHPASFWVIVRNAAIYIVLIIFALIMIFPFLVMLFTSLKEPSDTFSYPPPTLSTGTTDDNCGGL